MAFVPNTKHKQYIYMSNITKIDTGIKKWTKLYGKAQARSGQAEFMRWRQKLLSSIGSCIGFRIHKECVHRPTYDRKLYRRHTPSFETFVFRIESGFVRRMMLSELIYCVYIGKFAWNPVQMTGHSIFGLMPIVPSKTNVILHGLQRFFLWKCAVYSNSFQGVHNTAFGQSLRVFGRAIRREGGGLDS